LLHYIIDYFDRIKYFCQISISYFTSHTQLIAKICSVIQSEALLAKKTSPNKPEVSSHLSAGILFNISFLFFLS